MNCASCGNDIQSGFAYCPKCGAKQPRACARCGNPCPPDFAFCPKCGAAVSGPASEALDAPPPVDLRPKPPPARGPEHRRPAAGKLEPDADRRTITVLFADLSGFTALSEQLDPEVMQSLQNELFEELTAAVQSFGGFVDKFIGDAMLALFGAPLAHEDDPERALHAALDMVKRSARVAVQWQARAGSALALHIGVNTGPVVAGGIGAGDARAYSVTGDTVNTAQRLQALAGAGEALVGPLTYRLTRHAFAYDSLGALALRGKVGAVLVHRLLGPLDEPRPARGLEALGLSAPMIGRDAELARILNCLDAACGGAAQLVRLSGEAGIGKSRLVNEFLSRMRDDARFAEVAVRRVACSSLGEQSYGTLAAVVRSATGIGQKDTPAETRGKLTALLAELRLPPDEAQRLMPLLFYVLGLGEPDVALRHVEPEQVRRQILFALRTIFERRLALSPLLIVIEDLHWANSTSLETLRFLIDRLERSRLMLVVTHRPLFEADHFDACRTGLTALRLAPLGPADGRRLLSELFGAGWSEVARDLGQRILERAGGNPLFVEEIVRGLIEVGSLRREGSLWRIIKREAAADIPANIHALLLARMDRLPQEARRLVQEAAAIGPRFEAALLKSISTDPGKVEAGLDLLCDAEILEEAAGVGSVSPQAYRFTQTMLHDVIYHNLLLQRRTEMHARIGEALERLYGEYPTRLEDLALLGHHFSLTDAKTKGVRYLMAAADRARETYANDDAIRLYRQALAALTSAVDFGPERLTLCERIADLCGPAGQRETAQEHYQMVLTVYGAAADRPASARILRKLGRLLWDSGKPDQAEAHYGKAAELLEGTDDMIERAHLMQERGRLAFRTGDQAAAAKWADEALGCVDELATNLDAEARVEAARATAEALNTKGVALARLGRNRDALREVERSVTVAEAAGLIGVACRGYTNLGVLYTVIDPRRAIAVSQRGLDQARRIGDLGFQARLLANLAVAFCTFTDRCAKEGVPAAEEAVEIDRALDQRDHLPVPLIVLGQIHQCHGRPDLAHRYYHEALDEAQRTGEPQMLFPCYDGLATLSLDQNDLTEADRYFALAQQVCAEHGLEPSSLIALPFLD